MLLPVYNLVNKIKIKWWPSIKDFMSLLDLMGVSIVHKYGFLLWLLLSVCKDTPFKIPHALSIVIQIAKLAFLDLKSHNTHAKNAILKMGFQYQALWKENALNVHICVRFASLEQLNKLTYAIYLIVENKQQIYLKWR